MMAAFRNLKIGTKLPIVMVVLVLMTTITLTIVSMLMTQSMVTTAAQKELRAIALLKSGKMKSLIDNVERDLRIQAQAPAISQALIALADGYDMLGDDAEETLRRVYIAENPNPLGQKDQLVKADTGSSYGFIHAIYHPTLDQLQNEMEYYDVFLFDTEGNLVYSVFKENDFATNMLSGEWRESGLADAFRQAIDNTLSDPTVFIDFAPYAPSNLAPAAFMSRPVYDQTGKLLGVLAYQMPVGLFSAAANQLEGMGESADGFVVGSDFLMRTDSLLTEQDDVLSTTVENDSIKAGLAGDQGNFEGTSHLGAETLGYYVPFMFGDAKWVYVAQAERDELLEQLPSALLTIGLISVVIVGLAVVASVVASRSIALPVRSLTAAVGKVANGELETVVPETQRGDEIGELARATEVFRKSAVEMEGLNEQQAKATEELKALSAEKEAAAEREAEFARDKEAREEAAKAEHADMMRKLGESIGSVVGQAKMGNFSSRVEAQFDDETLTTLSTNVNELLDSVDNGLSAAGETLGRIAKGDLREGMTGEFHGAFQELQDSTNAMVDALKKLIGGIAGSTDNLAHSSSELRDTSDMLSKQAEQNAASLEETAAALEELSASIKQVDSNITNASNSAQTASDTANEGRTVASQAADAMNSIKESSTEISKVVGVINDISFQINLLALNAGVEAARAGEAGRGFSVVASEVRSLAQRASEASSEIASVIAKSDAAVSKGVEKVADAESSLQKISENVSGVSGSIEEIAHAISEQVSGVADINTAVAQIDQNTQRQAASFEEVTAASALLSNEADALKTSSSQFNTGATVVSLPPKRPTPSLAKAAAPASRAVSNGNLAELNEGWEEF